MQAMITFASLAIILKLHFHRIYLDSAQPSLPSAPRRDGHRDAAALDTYIRWALHHVAMHQAMEYNMALRYTASCVTKRGSLYHMAWHGTNLHWKTDYCITYDCIIIIPWTTLQSIIWHYIRSPDIICLCMIYGYKHIHIYIYIHVRFMHTDKQTLHMYACALAYTCIYYMRALHTAVQVPERQSESEVEGNRRDAKLPSPHANVKQSSHRMELFRTWD